MSVLVIHILVFAFWRECRWWTGGIVVEGDTRQEFRFGWWWQWSWAAHLHLRHHTTGIQLCSCQCRPHYRFSIHHHAISQFLANIMCIVTRMLVEDDGAGRQFSPGSILSSFLFDDSNLWVFGLRPTGATSTSSDLGLPDYCFLYHYVTKLAVSTSALDSRH